MDDGLEACARAALAADFDPVPWDVAPEWRRRAARAVAREALNTGSADFTRAAWVLEMTAMGWRWDKAIDEKTRTHPGIVFGELTRGGSRHWENVVAKVREIASARGVRMLEL